MAGRKKRQRRPNRKNETEKAKRKKTQEEVTPGPNATKKISDVNDDCLEKIFMELDLKDLLSVADSSKKLKTAAEMAFKSKYGKRNVEIWFFKKVQSTRR